MTSTISVNDSQRLGLEPLEVPHRLLLGPGPSNAHPAVLQAMNTTPVGHLDPAFLTPVALHMANRKLPYYRRQWHGYSRNGSHFS